MLKCVMYFSEYILKYIISKVKKKMLIAITMNISFTQMPGSIGHQSNWHGASGTRWGTTEGQRPGKHLGGGGGVHVTPASRLLLWSCWWELALEKCLRLLSPLSLTPSQQRRGTLSETDRSSGQVLSSSTLGIQDAGLLLPRWRWAWVSRMDVFWVFTVHSWRRRSKPVSALGLSLILLPSINRNPIV